MKQNRALRTAIAELGQKLTDVTEVPASTTRQSGVQQVDIAAPAVDQLLVLLQSGAGGSSDKGSTLNLPVQTVCDPLSHGCS